MPASKSQRKTQLPRANQQQNHRALFLGMLVWFLHLIILDALTSVACEWHWLTNQIAGIDELQFVEMGIGLISLVIIAYLIYQGWRNWRSLQSRPPMQNPRMLEDTMQDRGAFLAFVSMMLNVFFLLFILATFVPMFSFVACGQA